MTMPTSSQVSRPSSMASRPTTAPWGTKRRVPAERDVSSRPASSSASGEGGQGEGHVVGGFEEGAAVVAGDVGVGDLDHEVGAAAGEGAQVLEDVLRRQPGDRPGLRLWTKAMSRPSSGRVVICSYT